jgi:osmotically-inducible protein OsmY
LSAQAAATTAANSAAPVPSAAETTTPPVAITAPAIATDTEITTKVKSEIAADSPGGSQSVGVLTTDGVVALTGSLASQDAIDHLKFLVANIKDVKSVDTSALSVAVL